MEQQTLIDVLSNYTVEIPIIQRDYAQGREHETTKRERFLKALHAAVSEVGNGINLDFIYGSLENKSKKLIPLDGQQRLTTLFLLHWYAAKRENIDSDQWECLGKFTYATRVSARRFCEQLLKYTPQFDAITLSSEQTDSKKTISKVMVDEAWFSQSWSKDPTVEAMLVMLDAIDRKFRDVARLWERLYREKRITFCFEALENMGLTDDIYIKMNSRGKQLTSFEHFKAEFSKALGREDIIRKIDRDWTDILWGLDGDRSENGAIDDAFLAYFRFITDIIDPDGEKERNGKDEWYFDAIKVYRSNEENLKYLERYFDCWKDVNTQEYFSDYLSQNGYEPSKVALYDKELDLFKECCCKFYKGFGAGSFSYGKILMLYAFVLRRTEGMGIDDTAFRRRIRILRNLVFNSSYELRADNMGNLLKETRQLLLEGPHDGKKSKFNGRQYGEEVRKLEWCKNNQEYAEKLFKLEDNELLRGCTAILTEYTPERIEKLNTLLSQDLMVITRALLTYGDCRIKVARWHYTCWILGNGSTYVWKELLHPSTRKERFNQLQRAVINLLDSCPDVTTASLEKRIGDYLGAANTPKDWRYYFTKYPAILESAYYGMFLWGENEENVDANDTDGYMARAMGGVRRGQHVWNAISIAIQRKNNDDKMGLTLGLLSNHEGLSFSSGNKRLEIQQGCIVISDNESELKREPIPQRDGVDTVDRVELALSLIGEFSKK